MKVQSQSIGWEPETGSGLRPRPDASQDEFFPRRDEITTPVPAVALLEAARAMNEPEPPLDLGLYRALERRSDAEAESEPPPRSSRRIQRPLAAELGLDHLLEAEGNAPRSWALWLRSHGLWVAAGIIALWLAVSFVAHWLATPWP